MVKASVFLYTKTVSKGAQMLIKLNIKEELVWSTKTSMHQRV